MPLISVNISQSALSSLLSTLERIAVALERLAGPAHVYTPPVIAQLSDLIVASPDDIATAKLAADQFARENLVVPGSEAYIAAVCAYEQEISRELGDEAVANLPWRLKRSAPIVPAE